MDSIFIGSLVLSVFHALIPSHWLPVLAVGRREGWSAQEVMWVTFWAGLAHVFSTLLAGFLLAWLGHALSVYTSVYFTWIAPCILIGLGIFYIYQHYFHHHFHLHRQNPRWGVVFSLAVAMFLSPCFEIEGYFLAAGQYGWHVVLLLGLMYALVTIVGMLLWVWLALRGLQRFDWHALEHYAGLIAGITLVVSGIVMALPV